MWAIWFLINDGKIVIKVEETTDTDVKGLVIHGGKISNHKGINLPNVNLNMKYMSEQDREDILFALRMMLTILQLLRSVS